MRASLVLKWEAPMKKISYRGEASKVIGVAKKWDLNLRTPRNQSYDAVLILDEIENLAI